MIDNAVIVLPQPDSPTTPSVSPWSTCSVTPSTAWTTPSLSWMWVRRSWTCSSAVTEPLLPALQPVLERVAERVADEVERDAGQDDADAGRVDQPPVVAALDVVQPAGQHRTPVGRGRGHAQPEEAEPGQDEDRVRNGERGLHDDHADRVRQDVPGHRPQTAPAEHLN